MKKYKLYILLSHTGSFVSKCIGVYTKKTYSHVSLALDQNLDEIYSFSRLKPHNPLIGGFIREDIDTGTFSYFPNTICALYSIDISEIQYKQIRLEIRKFITSNHKYKYNYLGLIGLLLNSPIKRQHYYFCSQFVAEVLNNSGIMIVDKDAGLTTPNDFFDNKNLQLVYEGNLNNYKRNAVSFCN